MQQEQIKALIVNILTAGVVVGVLVAAYFVFIKKDIPVVGSVISSVTSVAQIAEETALIGSQIDTTVSDLGDLASAVESSNVIFELPSFKNLRDFSVAIPEEYVGRDNPFVPTIWKINMKNQITTGNDLSPSVPESTTNSPLSTSIIEDQVSQELPIATPSSGI
jgi:hypothetical protein